MTGSGIERSQSPGPWEKLFATGGVASLTMWLLRRDGTPFLLLPGNRSLAVKGLDLYPAQTRKARMAKACLRAALRFGLRVGQEKVIIKPRADDFAAYLSREVGTNENQPPAMALLAGNPRARGQRCIVLVFNAGGEPGAVVKAGSGEDAERLIAQEENFLRNVPAGTPGVPRLRSTFRNERIRALATDYFEGSTRPSNLETGCAALLSSWIQPGLKLQLGELGGWRRLEAAGGPLPRALQALGRTTVCPVLFHGDFAPWNIRVKDGAWMLVDWERGEMNGPPMWDWLHCVVQPAILVEGAGPGVVLERIQGMIQGEAFTRYAERTGICGSERALALAYLYYCIRVLSQTEGLGTVQALASAAERKWFPEI